MNDVTHTCINTQIRNDGGEESIAFWRKHKLPPVSVPYPHPETASRTGKQILSHFYGAEKAYNTAMQNHYALDKNKLKQRPINTPALSESIICAVQWGMWIMAVQICITIIEIACKREWSALLLTCKHHKAIKSLLCLLDIIALFVRM